ncbi:MULTISPECIES: TerD family protein [unclassified Streptomyces]|uniref:TerD family protein n=1 Tax=unclassified Streptomyces TaxID=2593676 RepID=UPI001F046BE1|nr:MULTISPECIES: TerD family protein [unclassified Streptomyces]MCH0562710.1 TerD family protein [Streptomyces sp. MUM 2J]MCH0567778.1 TerD family protein [Streptomyces sp. MUM 136J]
MTAELVRGQNHPLTQVRLEVRISAGSPVVAAATLSDEHGIVPGAAGVAHPGVPALPGVEVPRQAAADHRLAIDLDALRDTVHRVDVLLALPGGGRGPVRFGAVAAPFVAVTGLDGTEVATYTLTGLDAERAVVALEFYRRRGAWKVRAVGQGYVDGLAGLLTDQGLPEARRMAAEIDEAVAQGLAHAIPAPAPGAADAEHAHRPDGPAASGGGPFAHGAGEPTHPTTPGTTEPHGTAASERAGDATRPAQTAPAPSGTPPRLAADTSLPGAAAASSAAGPIDYSHPRRQNAAHTAPPPAPPGQPREPVAGDATGWSMEERLYNQVWGMFEDLARTTAAYRSAVGFADARREKELDRALADPRSRIGGQGDAAREAARARHADLVGRAREVLDRDLAQLRAEADVVEPALPPAYARWDNPVWHGYRVPMEIPMALRVGDLHLPESDPLRIPMLLRLPLERGLWIDSGRPGSLDGPFTDSHALRRPAMETAVALTARLLAVYPAGAFTVHVVDPAGSAARPLEPLTRSGVLDGPPATGAAGAAEVLAGLTERVDLLHMAVRGGAADSLPPGFDTSRQLLLINDFPHGFDDRAVTRLRYLADEGPAVGVHLMMVADRDDSAGYGPLLDPLWRCLLRLTPVPDDHLADPWIGHTWTYEPALVPPGSQILRQVLAQVATARTNFR